MVERIDGFHTAFNDCVQPPLWDMTNDETFSTFHKPAWDRYGFHSISNKEKVVKNRQEVKQHKGLGYDCIVPLLFFFPVIVQCCILPLCLSLPSNHCGELKNNLLLVRSAEWILLLIVEVNTLFEYDQSPVIKGLLWFMKYSSKVSPRDSDAFRCISQYLKQTSADKIS